MDSLSSFLNVKEVSAYLALRTSFVYQLVEEKKIPHYRIGRQIRFKKSVLDQWVEEQKQEVVEIRAEERKILGSIKKKGGLDVDRIVKKAIEEAGKKRYTSQHGKPDQSKGLREEVEHGTV